MTSSAKSPLRHWPLRELALLLFLSVGAFFLIFWELDPNDYRILDSVTIGSLDVGNMTKSQAQTALETVLEESLYHQNLTLVFPEEEVTLTPAQLTPQVNVQQAVEDAYAYGRKTGTASKLSLTSYLEIQEAQIRQVLEQYAAEYNTDLTQPSWQIIGDFPELSSDKIDPSAPAQTLVLTKGHPEQYVDVDATMEAVMRSFASCLTDPLSVSVTTISDSNPSPLDLEELWTELTVAPVDDSLSFTTYQPVSGSWGYTFDLRSAEYRMTRAGWGETLEIPMEYVQPEILGEEVYFRDTLGQFDSPHAGTKNGVINLQLVCDLLDGHILQPGEEFSYNEVIGERTAERGFRPGPSYSGTRMVNTIGGGVCQGSSALNVCVLYADLEITERVNHGYVVGYTPIGQDAAVSWSTNTDYRFRNSTNFPIMIRAELDSEFLKIKLLGTDEKDYYIELKSTRGQDSALIYSNCYKLKYHKETGELLSKEFSIRSTYLPR